MKRYYKYFICGEHMLRALDKEKAIAKFKKTGLNTDDMIYTIDYKKAVRIANANGGVIYGSKTQLML